MIFRGLLKTFVVPLNFKPSFLKVEFRKGLSKLLFVLSCN
jgi:hypothetical protein